MAVFWGCWPLGVRSIGSLFVEVELGFLLLPSNRVDRRCREWSSSVPMISVGSYSPSAFS